MKVLIPILTNAENDPAFVSAAAEGSSEIHLLRILDITSKNELPASVMMQGKEIIQEIETQLKEAGKQVEDVVEWGDPVTKVTHYAQLKKIKRIALKKEDSQFMKELVKKLREAKLDVQLY